MDIITSSTEAAKPQYVSRLWVSDILAGATGAAAGIPQAMAFSVVAGLNPIHGLVAAFVGTAAGALTSSTALLTIGPTNAVALAVGAILIQTGSDDPVTTLAGLTLLVGLFQLFAGVLNLGGITRYVSNAVMTGFISGAALLILMGQTGPLLGINHHGQDIPLLRFMDILRHVRQTQLTTLAAGLVTVGIVLALNQTRFKPASWLCAIVVASVLVSVLGWSDVRLVDDVGSVPQGLPGIQLPDLLQLPDLILPALAVAILGLVQSAGLTRSMGNTNPTKPTLSRDFVSQGIGNLSVALLQGLPVAGSISRTAVNIAAGARTRRANLIAGSLVGLSLFTFGSLAGRIPLSSLAGVLYIAALSLLDVRRIRQVWRTYWPGRIAMGITFILTLILPLEQSIYVGVLISLTLFVYSSAEHIKLVQLFPRNGGFVEREVPPYVPASHPIVIEVRGNLYFGAVYTLERMLPDLNGVVHPVVIFRLRGEAMFGSTFLTMLERYAKELHKAKGRLILTGLSEEAHEQLVRAGVNEWLPEADIVDADPMLLEATGKALRDARQWQNNQHHSAS